MLGVSRRLRKNCHCQYPVNIRHNNIWCCDCGLFSRWKFMDEAPALSGWQSVPGWWARWVLLRDMRRDLRLHKRRGFRQAFPLMQTRDFYCSNECCRVKHHVY